MLDIQFRENTILVRGEDNKLFPDNGYLAYPMSSLILQCERDNEDQIVLFRSADTFDVLFSAKLNELRLDGMEMPDTFMLLEEWGRRANQSGGLNENQKQQFDELIAKSDNIVNTYYVSDTYYWDLKGVTLVEGTETNFLYTLVPCYSFYGSGIYNPTIYAPEIYRNEPFRLGINDKEKTSYVVEFNIADFNDSIFGYKCSKYAGKVHIKGKGECLIILDFSTITSSYAKLNWIFVAKAEPIVGLWSEKSLRNNYTTNLIAVLNQKYEPIQEITVRPNSTLTIPFNKTIRFIYENDPKNTSNPYFQVISVNGVRSETGYKGNLSFYDADQVSGEFNYDCGIMTIYQNDNEASNNRFYFNQYCRYRNESGNEQDSFDIELGDGFYLDAFLKEPSMEVVELNKTTKDDSLNYLYQRKLYKIYHEGNLDLSKIGGGGLTPEQEQELKNLRGDVENALGDISALEIDKQDKLKSGENIKTVNGESLLGEGNIEVSGSSAEPTIHNININYNNLNIYWSSSGYAYTGSLKSYITDVDFADYSVGDIMRFNDGVEFILTSQTKPVGNNGVFSGIINTNPNGNMPAPKFVILQFYGNILQSAQIVTPYIIKTDDDQISMTTELFQLTKNAYNTKQNKLSGNYLVKFEQNGGQIDFTQRGFDGLSESTKSITFKTVNGQSLFGMGDIQIEGGGSSGSDVSKTHNVTGTILTNYNNWNQLNGYAYYPVTLNEGLAKSDVNVGDKIILNNQQEIIITNIEYISAMYSHIPVGIMAYSNNFYKVVMYNDNELRLFDNNTRIYGFGSLKSDYTTIADINGYTLPLGFIKKIKTTDNEWTGTAKEYEALGTYNDNTTYYVIEE